MDSIFGREASGVSPWDTGRVTSYTRTAVSEDEVQDEYLGKSRALSRVSQVNEVLLQYSFVRIF